MLTCKEASRLVSGSLDRHLRLSERLALRVHLLVCEACARFAAQAKFLRRAAARAADTEAVLARPRLGADARARITKTLRER